MGIALSDAASVTGGDNPTGTVTFKLFGPGDSACNGAPLLTNTVGLSGGAATSGRYATAAAGIYRWTALYNGDRNNGPAMSGCGTEDVTVAAAGGVAGVTTTPTPKPSAKPTAPPTATPTPKATGAVKGATTPTTPTTPNTGADLLGPLSLFVLGATLLGLAAVVRRRPTFSS